MVAVGVAVIRLEKWGKLLSTGFSLFEGPADGVWGVTDAGI
jgi:hypothetical protein